MKKSANIIILDSPSIEFGSRELERFNIKMLEVLSKHKPACAYLYHDLNIKTTEAEVLFKKRRIKTIFFGSKVDEMFTERYEPVELVIACCKRRGARSKAAKTAKKLAKDKGIRFMELVWG